MVDFKAILKNEKTLDIQNWDYYEALAHKMVDDIFLVLQTVKDQPVWQKPPEFVKFFKYRIASICTRH